MSGALNKTSTSETKINEDVSKAASQNWQLAQNIAKLGYQPNRGVTIAAFTPQQEAAMRGTNTAANAFGMGMAGDPLANMPQAETSASGIRGYSTGADYDQMISRLPPEYRAQMEQLFQTQQKQPAARANFGFNPLNPFAPRNSSDTDRGGVNSYGGGSRSIGGIFG